MNMIVNSLPTKTWNHLKMNGASVDLEGEYRNKSALASWDDQKISWDPEAKPYPAGARKDLAPALNQAVTGFGQTEENVIMDAPLVLRYGYSYGEKSASHLVLHAKKNSLLKALVVLESEGGSAETALLQTEVYAEENAKVELYVAQLLSNNGLCVNHIGGVCAENANITLTRLELGAGKLYSGVNIDLKGKESSFNAEVGYHAKPGQMLDMNYVSFHEGPRTNCLMEINGTLEEGAKKVFRGTIDFQKGCAGAKGTENENVLLMSEDVVNQTLPVILCKEEDVEGNHGASIGQLDEKILFYLGSRGMSREAAQQLIAQARIEAICSQIPDEEVQTQIREFQNIGGISHGAQL